MGVQLLQGRARAPPSLRHLRIRPGITATTDLDQVSATNPECAVYLQYPWQTFPDELVTPIENAATADNARPFVSGIDSGLANDLIRLALAGTCRSIEPIRCNGDHTHAELVATAARVVNAILAVLARAARNQNDPRLAPEHRKRAVRWLIAGG